LSLSRGLRIYKIRTSEVIVGIDSIKRLGEVAKAFGYRGASRHGKGLARVR
jgi:hypothetical protein